MASGIPTGREAREKSNSRHASTMEKRPCLSPLAPSSKKPSLAGGTTEAKEGKSFFRGEFGHDPTAAACYDPARLGNHLSRDRSQGRHRQ
jgi:hypothetical protein